MSQRSAGASVKSKVLQLTAAGGRRTLADRLLGRDPLPAGAHPWYSGALGEIEVAALLDGLGEDWYVIHAVPVGTRGADVDHVVIGPPGVVVVNTKRHLGAGVWVGERAVLVSGMKVNWLSAADTEADRVFKRLDRCWDGPLFVVATIAVVGINTIKFGGRPANGVSVVTSRDLVEHLKGMRQRLGPSQVQALAQVVDDPATWGLDPQVALADPDEEFARLDAAVRAAPERVRSRYGYGAALAFALAGVMAVFIGNFFWALARALVPALGTLP